MTKRTLSLLFLVLVVSVVVSGTFPGSPVTLDYHFVIAGGKISLLAIDS